MVRYLGNKYGRSRWQRKPKSGDLSRDLVAGRECLARGMEADWWGWKQGSRPFFWRWPQAHQVEARDGYRQCVEGELPRYRRPQPREFDPSVRKAVQAKLLTVRGKGYITKGKVCSLTSYFCVPKGDQDIRMVYDATKSRLNSCLWAPNFGLPTVNTLTQNVNPKPGWGIWTLAKCS